MRNFETTNLSDANLVGRFEPNLGAHLAYPKRDGTVAAQLTDTHGRTEEALTRRLLLGFL